MGSGSWTHDSYRDYSKSVGRIVTKDGLVAGEYSAQEMFKQRHCSTELNPKNVIRECKDSAEHPNTLPVILGLDVTGSMGPSAVEVAKKLNIIMTKLYEQCEDIEFAIMGIGDLAYDRSPIQMSQFESDIRIAEQLDKIWFEAGGGGNSYESYTAAWYMGARHTKLDCLNRNVKGIIITMGDELLNPALPRFGLENATGDSLQADVETTDLYDEASKMFDIYHLVVEHGYWSSESSASNRNSFAKVIGENKVRVVDLQNISDAIIEIIQSRYNNKSDVSINNNNETISW